MRRNNCFWSYLVTLYALQYDCFKCSFQIYYETLFSPSSLLSIVFHWKTCFISWSSVIPHQKIKEPTGMLCLKIGLLFLAPQIHSTNKSFLACRNPKWPLSKKTPLLKIVRILFSINNQTSFELFWIRTQTSSLTLTLCQ